VVTVARYEIRLPYALSENLAEAFPELTAIQVAPASTMLVGELRDQSDLQGVLARIADMGLDITEVRRAIDGSERPAHL
jgi:hypothetical protein